MIEYVPLLLGVAAFIPSGKKDDRKKIDDIFKNINFGVKDKFPLFMKKWHTKNYTAYLYSKPLGLMNNDKLEAIVAHSLSKPVKIQGERDMLMKVYHSGDLPKWTYDEVEDKKGWNIPVGRSLDGMVWHDFEKTPHMTVAGTTRFGKTVFLKSMMTYLIEHHPDTVEFYVIDLKGGMEFHRYRHLKQVKYVASDPEEAHTMLGDLQEVIKEKMLDFKENNYTNVIDSPIQKRTFIIVDEGAQLAPDKSMSKKKKEMLGDCQNALSEVARVAGALGWRLVFCTQYPTADTLPRQIKQNSDAKISFRLPTDYASKVAIDEYGAEELEGPGRAIYKTHDRVEVQVPLLADEDMWERLRGWECASVREVDDQAGGSIVELG